MNITNAVCVLLDKRIDYWEDIKSSFNEINIHVKPYLCGDGKNELLNYKHIDTTDLPPKYDNSIHYPTWWARPNAYNCWKAHKSIIKNSLDRGHDHLLMLEDDVFIESDFREIWESVQPFFEENKWDMIYFGSYNRKDTCSPTDNPNVLRVNGCAGWHGVLMNAKVMERLMSFAPIGPYDYICGKYIHPTFNCYSIYPSILSQRDNIYSHVEGSNLGKPKRDEIL